MLSVCLVFLYVLVTAYLTGFLALRGISALYGRILSANGSGKKGAPTGCGLVMGTAVKSDACLMAGLIFTTVYAQLFSLFHKVGFLANLLLVLGCMLTAAIFRRRLADELKQMCQRTGKGKGLFYIFLFLLFAYGTSRGIIHYDTGLYHAQSIRWIEEYGVVRGLGNLHCRLAYNSASFSLSALYSFAFLGGQSYHCMAGFFALLLAKVCSEITGAWKRKALYVSDIARLAGFYYLFVIFDEMVSPASDYFTVLTIFYIVIRYLDLIEKKEGSWIPYALLSLAGVYTMSLKLSAAPILLLAAKPALMLLGDRDEKNEFLSEAMEEVGRMEAKRDSAEKNEFPPEALKAHGYKHIINLACCLGLGILILAPCLIRNVLISGWLVYPFTGLDLFSVDWKVPEGIAAYDAKEIQVWGRGIYDVSRYGESVWKWFPPWFAGLAGLDKIAVLAAIGAMPFSVAGLTAAIKKKEKRYSDLFLVAVIINLSFLFWLFSAPLIRYGCVYVWLAAPITFGAFALWLIQNKTFWRSAYVLLGILAAYKILALASEIAAAYSPQYFIYQKDYENYETESYQIQGIKFYYPTQGDQTGYGPFPSSPVKASIELRGAELKDGFRHHQPKPTRKERSIPPP